MTDAVESRRHATWLRAVLIGLQAAAVVGGVVLGTLTYDAWSQPEEPDPSSVTTTVVTQETPVPPDTLG